MKFCIPPKLIEKLKASAINGEVDIKKLYDMDSAGRKSFFSNYVGKELGDLLSVEFEKAMNSKRKDALRKWAESVYDPKTKEAPKRKTILDKINDLDKDGILTPKVEKEFLKEIVADQLGISVTPEQTRHISALAKKIVAAQKNIKGGIGDPANEASVTEFLLQKKKMDDYLLSQNPSNRLKVLTGTIGRGHLISNMEAGITEAIVRRVAAGTLKLTDTKLASDYVKMVNRIYQKTGYDISRMVDINDTGASGARVLGDTVHSQGPGAIRKYGRLVEDVIFKQAMGAPDVAFSSLAFADSVNINALKEAHGDPVLAKELMREAMQVDGSKRSRPLRAQGILDAQVATWTNKTWASDTTLRIRKVLNDLAPDARVGDFLMPFVKTGANVIATGMDYAGVGIPKAMFKIVNAFRTGDLKDPEVIRSYSRDIVRAGLGLTGAAILAQNIKDDDFVGAYDPKRQQIEELRNSKDNMFRIGNKWISTDYLGTLAVPFSAMMFARKYGAKGKPEMAFQYAKGVGSQVMQLPGVKDVSDTLKKSLYKKDTNLQEMGQSTGEYVSQQAFSRLVPSFVGTIAASIDPNQRRPKGTFQQIQSNIPLMRENLKVKKDIFGDVKKAEPLWSTILFGGRVKSDKETSLVKELSDIQDKMDKPITFTDWDKSSQKRLTQFKDRVGPETFETAKQEYGTILKNKITKVIQTPTYKLLSDEGKHKLLSDLDQAAMNEVLKDNGFKYRAERGNKRESNIMKRLKRMN